MRLHDGAREGAELIRRKVPGHIGVGGEETLYEVVDKLLRRAVSQAQTKQGFKFESDVIPFSQSNFETGGAFQAGGRACTTSARPHRREELADVLELRAAPRLGLGLLQVADVRYQVVGVQVDI